MLAQLIRHLDTIIHYIVLFFPSDWSRALLEVEKEIPEKKRLGTVKTHT